MFLIKTFTFCLLAQRIKISSWNCAFAKLQWTCVGIAGMLWFGFVWFYIENQPTTITGSCLCFGRDVVVVGK